MSSLSPASEQAPLESGSRAEQAQSVWRGWRGTAFAIAIAVFLLAGIATARFAYLARMTEINYTVEDEVVAGNEQLDEAPAEELSMLFEEFRSMRLAVKDRPLFYRYNQFSQEQATSALIAGSITALGLFAALGLWFTAPKPKPKS